jgi:topoisomerase-4 subunit A
MSESIKSNIRDILSEKYLAYAISTIISRSLPDVRDGLKPVHRRIIYSMHLLKLNNQSPFKKSARIVGDVMGKFHPHGDQAIYDSLVRLAQDFSTRMPLIEGQGNFGNIDGDNPAAMRYTEARLSAIANYFFDGIDENAVDFRENYDGQNLEPVVLPSKLPNILLNGSTGIAVGMATNIPPHNLTELNKSIILLIKNPSISLNSLFKHLNGPDLPTGGQILLSPDEKNSIYKLGRGSFIIRSKWNLEKLKNNLYQIIITEIPYQVNKARLIEQLANLTNNKKIPLDDILDESDENIRIVLKPKNKNIDPNKLIEICFKLSDLSIKFNCNFNVLENGKVPKQLGLKDILNNFILHRRETIKRKSTFNINRIKNKLEILNGYLIAYKFLDQIIKIIRTKNEPKKEIIKKFKLNLNQADAILNMKLGSLRKLDEHDTKDKINKLSYELKYLNKLIKDKKVLDDYLVNELTNINKDIDQELLKRKSSIIIKDIQNLEVDLNEFEEVDKLTVVVTKDSLIKTFKDHIDLKKINDSLKNVIISHHIYSNQKVLLFVSSGRVFTLDPSIFPSGKSNPKNFIYFVDTKSNDKLINLLPNDDNLSCLVASNKGKGFIADLKNIITSQKKGKQLFNLKNDDFLIKVIKNNKKFIACVSKFSKLLIFEVKYLPVLNKGGGVLLQKIKLDDRLIDIYNFDLAEGLSWKSKSGIHSEKNFKFWIGKRAQTGKKVPKKFNKNLKFYD